MKQIITFFKQLAKNNNKQWFDGHRDEYDAIKKEHHAFVDEFITKLSKYDKAIAGLTAKDVTYRINRDIRFSTDKSPYKTHIGAYICPNGKKSGYSGYYLHIEPKNCLLATGIHNTYPQFVNSIREDILSRTKEFETTLKKAKGFVLDEDGKLKIVPKNFPKDHAASEYLKYKNVCLIKFFDDSLLNDKQTLLKFVVEEFKNTVSFNQFLNRAIDFLSEE